MSGYSLCDSDCASTNGSYISNCPAYYWSIDKTHGFEGSGGSNDSLVNVSREIDRQRIVNHRPLRAHHVLKANRKNSVDRPAFKTQSAKRTSCQSVKFIKTPNKILRVNYPCLRHASSFIGQHWRARLKLLAHNYQNIDGMDVVNETTTTGGNATSVMLPEKIAEIVVKYGNVDSQYYKLLLDTFRDDGSMDMFHAAVTAKDFDKLLNYEYFEYIGDSVVNRFIIDYIRDNYHGICNTAQNIGIMTKLRSIYVGKWNLSKCCVSLGLHRYIRSNNINSDVRKLQAYAHRSKRNAMSNTNQPKVNADSVYTDETAANVHRDTISLLEDVMEAFVGALWCSLMNSSHRNTIVKQFVYGVIGDYAGIINPTYENLNSARDRLQIASKEIYGDRLSLLKRTNVDSTYTCTVYMEGSGVIACATANRNKDAIYRASCKAMNMMPELERYVPNSSVMKVDNVIIPPCDFEKDQRRFRQLMNAFEINHNIDLNEHETLMIRSIYTDPCLNADVNYNIEHFNADALTKHIMNMYLIRKYPKLRNSDGIQIMQTINEKFRASRSVLCSLIGIVDMADLAYDTASQRIKMDDAMSYMFDAAVSVMYTIVENRKPGYGDAMLLRFFTKCNQCLDMRIDYDYLVSPQLKLLRMVKFNHLRHEYILKSANTTSVNAVNYREGVLEITNSKGVKIYSGWTRAIDEKTMKNKLAQECIEVLTNRGWSLSVPDAYSSSDCSVWWW
ncbi:RNaseIII [Heliothis virescens ascovirus 3j]|uniref:RNaseIII n=1 Tax=Heliothis virescens ascovirus 3j TaxID=1561067 RepID=A0A2Z5UZA2_9VIRU|nr:RNaseIII [Heliothis virescens ascovirus 3j]